MRRTLLLPALVMAAAPAIAATPEAAARHAIEAALSDSAAGWDAGDLDRFMRVYADARATTYVTATGLAHGRAEIARHYQAYFGGDKDAERGRLSFETLDFRLIDPAHALLIARYTVAPAGARTTAWTGPTTLLFARTPAGWKIVADHSS